ncbi:hypothetical protein [Streptomyces sp. NPDC058268]
MARDDAEKNGEVTEEEASSMSPFSTMEPEDDQGDEEDDDG